MLKTSGMVPDCLSGSLFIIDVHYVENSCNHVTNSLSKNLNNNPELLTTFVCKSIRCGLFSLLCAYIYFASNFLIAIHFKWKEQYMCTCGWNLYHNYPLSLQYCNTSIFKKFFYQPIQIKRNFYMQNLWIFVFCAVKYLFRISLDFLMINWGAP